MSVVYKYTPELLPDAPFFVETIDAESLDLEGTAETFQEIMLESYARDYSGMITESEVRQRFDPGAKGCIDQQVARFRDPVENGFVIAWKPFFEGIIADMPTKSLGVGEAARGYLNHSSTDVPLVDIGGIHTRPTVRGFGVGAAMLHVILDNFPSDAPVITHTHTENHRAMGMFLDYGFKPWYRTTSPLFGEVDLQVFLGPEVDDLRNRLITKHAWLTRRTIERVY